MSNIEYEAKIYDVDPADIAGKLAKLDAKEVGSYNFRRYVFDTIPAKPDRWVRLRSDGKQATLTVKEITAEPTPLMVLMSGKLKCLIWKQHWKY